MNDEEGHQKPSLLAMRDKIAVRHAMIDHRIIAPKIGHIIHTRHTEHCLPDDKTRLTNREKYCSTNSHRACNSFGFFVVAAIIVTCDYFRHNRQLRNKRHTDKKSIIVDRHFFIFCLRDHAPHTFKSMIIASRVGTACHESVFVCLSGRRHTHTVPQARVLQPIIIVIRHKQQQQQQKTVIVKAMQRTHNNNNNNN